MEEITYISPQENLGRDEEPKHTIEFKIDDEVIGKAEIEYFSKPFPLYQISDLYIEPEHQGEGKASKIMEKVEEMLKERKKPGVLVDAIDEDSPAKGMYQRRGWQEVPDQGGLFVYNLPDKISIDQLRGYRDRYTFYDERQEK